MLIVISVLGLELFKDSAMLKRRSENQCKKSVKRVARLAQAIPCGSASNNKKTRHQTSERTRKQYKLNRGIKHALTCLKARRQILSMSKKFADLHSFEEDLMFISTLLSSFRTEGNPSNSKINNPQELISEIEGS